MAGDWWPDWRGQVAVVCASGPSLTQADVEACRGHRVIVTNDTWRAAPWCDVLYASDARWFLVPRLHEGYGGLKVCGDEQAGAVPGVRIVNRLRQNSFVWEGRTIGWGGNGGFQAINLAMRFGARRIALLGFDMRLRPGKAAHWHGDHEDFPNPRPAWVRRWRMLLDAQAPRARERGIEIVNCTPGSALQKYPRMTIGAALERWQAVAA